MKIQRSCTAMATKIDFGEQHPKGLDWNLPWTPPFELMTPPQCSRLRTKHLRLNMKPYNGLSISSCQILSNHDSKMLYTQYQTTPR